MTVLCYVYSYSALKRLLILDISQCISVIHLTLLKVFITDA